MIEITVMVKGSYIMNAKSAHQNRDVEKTATRIGAWWSSVSSASEAFVYDVVWIGAISRVGRAIFLLSQTELAESTNLARSTIYCLESQKMLPDSGTAEALKAYFTSRGLVCDLIDDRLVISFNKLPTTEPSHLMLKSRAQLRANRKLTQKKRPAPLAPSGPPLPANKNS